MNKIFQIKIFNDIVDQLLSYLEMNFVDFRSDIILAKSTIQFVRKSNPRMVVEQFMKSFGPYKKQIFECDEDFFLDFENNMNDKVSQANQLLGTKIRSIWMLPDTSQTQKAHIWMYFQKLIRAGDKVFT